MRLITMIIALTPIGGCLMTSLSDLGLYEIGYCHVLLRLHGAVNPCGLAYPLLLKSLTA